MDSVLHVKSPMGTTSGTASYVASFRRRHGTNPYVNMARIACSQNRM